MENSQAPKQLTPADFGPYNGFNPEELDDLVNGAKLAQRICNITLPTLCFIFAGALLFDARSSALNEICNEIPRPTECPDPNTSLYNVFANVFKGV